MNITRIPTAAPTTRKAIAIPAAAPENNTHSALFSMINADLNKVIYPKKRDPLRSNEPMIKDVERLLSSLNKLQ